MVSFTCQNCGDTLKENIAQHVGECKGPFPLTCIDCLEEFYDNQYKSHTRCASEVLEIPQLGTKPVNEERGKQETNSSSVVETKLSNKEETKPIGKVEAITNWIHVIDRVSQSPSLTPQQCSLLDAFATVRNVPKERVAFEKFAQYHWKEYDAHKTVIDEIFHWPQSQTAREPTWITAMRNYQCQPHLIQKKIVDKLLSYQKKNPVPLSLPNQQSWQNLIRRVFQNLSIDPQVSKALLDSIILEMKNINEQRETHKTVDANAVSETNEAERPVKEVASKKKKRDRKKADDTAEVLEEDAQSTTDEVPNKKSRKNKHKRQEEDFLDEAVPRKKFTKSA